MPQGVETFVDGGFATVDFVDRKLRGPALAKLIAIGGPESIETITRDGPRRKYRVPEGNASEAGLIDTPAEVSASGDAGYATALAAADPIAEGGTFRPDVHTVAGANDAGPVDQADVVGNTSILTTEVPADPAVTGIVPPHVEVVKRQQAATTAKRKSVRTAAAKKAASAAPVKRASTVNAELSKQTGALGTDPQAKADGTPTATPVDEPESPAPAPTDDPAVETPAEQPQAATTDEGTQS